MSEQPPDQFVADGQQRIRATDAYHQKMQEIRTRVWVSYHDQFAHASFWQRLHMRWKIRREISRACADLAPDEALYLHV
jgi:hypothetical protein